jgi:small-conductance mechanosensitive channel
MQERRVVFLIGVSYDTPPDTVARIPVMVREAVEAQRQVRFDRSHFVSYGDSALNFESVYFVLTGDYLAYADVNQAVNLAILRRFAAEKIAFAYPTRTVFVKGDNGAVGTAAAAAS